MHKQSGFRNKLTALLLLVVTVVNPVFFIQAPACAQLQDNATAPAYIRPTVNLAGGDNVITLRLRDTDVKTALRALSRKANFNVVVDSSVTGNLNVDFDNVSINNAVESMIDTLDLVYAYRNGTLTVAAKNSEMAKSLNSELTSVTPVKYVNAKLVAEILNNAVYQGGGKDDKNKKAGSDYRTNSVIIRGTDNDLRIGRDLIQRIDVPRESKTFTLSYADPIYVASVLSSTIFNDGIAPFNSSGKDIKASELRVIRETFQEGSGASEVSSGEERPTLAIRSKKLTDEKVTISPEGPIIVPDTRLNTITIMGTSDQINLAEQIIPTLDIRLPQVSIEVALVEISDSGVKELSSLFGSANGQIQTGFNNSQVSGEPSATAPAMSAQADGILVTTTTDPLTGFMTVTENTITNFFGRENNIVGIPTITESRLGGVGSGLAFTTNYLGKNSPNKNSSDILTQLNFLLTHKKAKVLSNPTVIAVHDTESVVSMVDEIVRSQTITRDATGFTQTQTEIGEAGITLNVVPKIGDDNTVTLRLRPSISFIKEVVQDPVTGGLTTLLTKRDMAFQELRLQNNATLAISGLINDSTSETLSKTPYLGDLPIVGALFRSSSRTKSHSELVLLITPKILDDNGSPIGSNFNRTNSSDLPGQIDLSQNPESMKVQPEREVITTTKPRKTTQKSPDKLVKAATSSPVQEKPVVQQQKKVVPETQDTSRIVTSNQQPQKSVAKDSKTLPSKVKKSPGGVPNDQDQYLNQLLDDLGLQKEGNTRINRRYSPDDIDKMLSLE